MQRPLQLQSHPPWRSPERRSEGSSHLRAPMTTLRTLQTAVATPTTALIIAPVLWRECGGHQGGLRHRGRTRTTCCPRTAAILMVTFRRTSRTPECIGAAAVAPHTARLRNLCCFSQRSASGASTHKPRYTGIAPRVQTRGCQALHRSSQCPVCRGTRQHHLHTAGSLRVCLCRACHHSVQAHRGAMQTGRVGRSRRAAQQLVAATKAAFSRRAAAQSQRQADRITAILMLRAASDRS